MAILLSAFSISQRFRDSQLRDISLEIIYKLLAHRALTTGPRTTLDAFVTRLDAMTPFAGFGAYPDTPSVAHTTRRMEYIGMREYHVLRGDYSCKDDLFHKLLGLPLLSTNMSLAFCSWTYRTVALLALIKSGRSTLLQKAAVLEDIYIW
jgi:hypothetical protein